MVSTSRRKPVKMDLHLSGACGFWSSNNAAVLNRVGIRIRANTWLGMDQPGLTRAGSGE